ESVLSLANGLQSEEFAVRRMDRSGCVVAVDDNHGDAARRALPLTIFSIGANFTGPNEAAVTELLDRLGPRGELQARSHVQLDSAAACVAQERPIHANDRHMTVCLVCLDARKVGRSIKKRSEGRSFWYLGEDGLRRCRD